MKKKCRIKLVNDQPYITDGFKTVATPEQIGFIVRYSNQKPTPEFFQSKIHEQITLHDINKLIINGGLCEIEMETYEGDGCGYRLPKLIDGKVIIYTPEKN